MMFAHPLLFLLLSPILLPIILVIVLFEIWMYIDVIINKHISSQEKLLWIVGMLIFHPFVAIAYFFVARSGLPPHRRTKGH